MAPVLLIGRLTAANKAGRDKMVKGLGKIADYAKEHDPETTRHATHILADGSDETTVVAIEEYTSQEACEKHFEWPPVKEFLELWKSDSDFHGGGPEIWHSNYVEAYTRPEIAKLDNPFVVLAKLSYSADTLSQAIEGWKPVIAHAKNTEPGVLSYYIGKDKEHENRLTLCEAYESESYFKDVHVASAPVQKKIKEEESLRKGDLDLLILKHASGYWHR